MSTTSAIMSSTSTSSSTSGSTSSASSANNLDYNSFLKLLLEQMKNQDPTQPVDQTQMLAQLAQFSALGQATQTNTSLTQLINNIQAQTGEGLIGHNVTSLTDGSTGVVKSVQITSSGVTAVLDSGTSFDISGGFKINS